MTTDQEGAMNGYSLLRTSRRKAQFGLTPIALSLLLAHGGAHALPTGGTVVAGEANITQPDSQRLAIQQTSPRAIINWGDFSIGATESVAFTQPGRDSVALNRVTSANPSGIYGQLSANGRVYLVNPNGILFGQGASINVGGLVASTRNIDNNDFMAGRDVFNGLGKVCTTPAAA